LDNGTSEGGGISGALEQAAMKAAANTATRPFAPERAVAARGQPVLNVEIILFCTARALPVPRGTSRHV
jgi:hypothetical protein